MNQSVSAKGDCYDNTRCEIFISSLKRELKPNSGYFESRHEVRLTLFEQIEDFHNTKIKQTSLGNLSQLQRLELNSNIELIYL